MYSQDYCILFTDGDSVIVDKEGRLVDSDDPKCPNTFDGVWNKVTKTATGWSTVKEQVDQGLDFGTGVYAAEIDNQTTGTIKHIIKWGA